MTPYFNPPDYWIPSPNATSVEELFAGEQPNITAPSRRDVKLFTIADTSASETGPTEVGQETNTAISSPLAFAYKTGIISYVSLYESLRSVVDSSLMGQMETLSAQVSDIQARLLNLERGPEPTHTEDVSYTQNEITAVLIEAKTAADAEKQLGPITNGRWAVVLNDLADRDPSLVPFSGEVAQMAIKSENAAVRAAAARVLGFVDPVYALQVLPSLINQERNKSVREILRGALRVAKA